MGDMKKYIKEERSRLTGIKEELETKLQKVDKQLRVIEKLEKPFVACVQSYSGGGSMAFATLEKAEKKLEEYRRKTYFKNGLNYGVYLYKHNEDGTREMVMEIPLQRQYHSPDLTQEWYG